MAGIFKVLLLFIVLYVLSASTLPLELEESVPSQSFAASDCNKGVQGGPNICLAYIPVYTWNNEQQQCVKAIYGGCRKTNNNFKTQEECQKIAKPICKKVVA